MFGRGDDLVIEPEPDLLAENRSLRIQIEELTARLAAESARRAELEASLGALSAGAGREAFEGADDGEAEAAFDRFFATPDPHLDKVRGFLLD